jgi:hypothetical protein
VKPGSDKLLAKAERALTAAHAALEGGAPDLAAARAFYAILNAAKVELNERGLRLRTHARIAAASPAPLSTWLSEAIDRRRSGDGEITDADADRLIERAAACVALVRDHLS